MCIRDRVSTQSTGRNKNNMSPLLILSISLLCFTLTVEPTDNGVGRTPALGYNSWNDFRCNINAEDIKSVADAMVRQGLDKAGYEYINIDDCWAAGRNADGTVYADPRTFPGGIVDVANYVHAKGFKFGIYTDRGTKTCAGRPGSQGYEKIDADTYAKWGVDYLKEDSCYATQDHAAAFEQYGKMRDALNATGRHIYFSLCGWNTWYSPVGWSLGNSWRIAGDCNVWDNVLNAIDQNAPLADNARPGGWNDPDMLIGSTPGSAASLPPQQSRTMFSQWAVMAAPLLIGSNIRNLSPFDLETYTNTEVIAVDQDPLGKQGKRVVGGPLLSGSKFNVWARNLANGDIALIFLNNDSSDSDIACDETCWSAIGFTRGQQVTVRDLWLHKEVGTATGSFTARAVPKNGGSTLVRLHKI
eukprot:TRINITY_DN36_c0_g1_i1.p1 TRINITY_DN36_c0_g1~~TRINITY_DN36_c0_g1_i1.p1  ORF type:complete len:414 (-),score=103.15 TRINITY_DN36_c0_g1_i1:32-1273(-)